MIFFWVLYYFISILICFCLYKIFPNKILAFLVTSFFAGILFSVWFLEPGSRNLAPIISIIFLENTIIQNNGFSRLARPLFAMIFLISLLLSIFYFIKKFLFKRK